MKKELKIRESESGVSLVGVLIGAGLAGFIALMISRNLTQGLQGQKKVEIYGELAHIEQQIGRYLDCDYSLAQARLQAGVSSNQALCNAASSSGADLLASKPIQLYAKTENGSYKSFTTDLNPAQFQAGRIGQWYLRAGCDWTNQSLVIRAARLQGTTFVKDPLTKTSLDWNNDRLLLFGGQTGQTSLCFMQTPSAPTSSASVTSSVAYLDTRGEITFDVPAGTTLTEIESNGQFQGTGDLGADVSFTRTMINLKANNFTGTQMVKIGSTSGKSRAVYWGPTSFGSAPILAGFTNPQMSANFRKEKMPSPLVQDKGAGPNGSRRFTYSEKLEDPGNNGQRWWATTILIRHFTSQ